MFNTKMQIINELKTTAWRRFSSTRSKNNLPEIGFGSPILLFTFTVNRQISGLNAKLFLLPPLWAKQA